MSDAPCKYNQEIKIKMTFSKISNKTLLKIASIGGIITCSTGFAMQWKFKDRIRNTDYYKEAFKEVRNHPGAKSLLGEPIKEGDISFRSSDSYFDREKAHFEVSLKGPKQKGILFLWANKIVDTDKWNVNRLELGLENEPDRRLLIKNVEQNTK